MTCKTTIALSLVLACGLLLAGPAFSALDEVSLNWHVIGAGGTSGTAAGTLSLAGTAGQAVAGQASPDLCAGFWCGAGFAGGHRVYLPLVVR
jgi:hypothetical protein